MCVCIKNFLHFFFIFSTVTGFKYVSLFVFSFLGIRFDSDLFFILPFLSIFSITLFQLCVLNFFMRIYKINFTVIEQILKSMNIHTFEKN